MDTRIGLQSNLYMGFSKTDFYLMRFLGISTKETDRRSWTGCKNKWNTACVSGYLFNTSRKEQIL